MKIAPPHLLRFTWIIKGACKGVKDCWCLLLKGSSSRCGLIPNKCWPSRKVTGAFTQLEIIGILLSDLVWSNFFTRPHFITWHHFFTQSTFSLCYTFHSALLFHPAQFSLSPLFYTVIFSLIQFFFSLSPTFSLGPLFHSAHFFT